MFVYKRVLDTTPLLNVGVSRSSFTQQENNNMATSLMRSSSGHHSFRRHLSELELAVTDPGRLAVELYSIGLVDRVARQRASLGSVVSVERSRELLLSLESKIEQNEGNFDKFLSILDRNPTMKDVCEKMRATRGI